jgi:hypothetical protein
LGVEQASFWIETAEQLSGSAKRMFMAKVVNFIGSGGQRFAERVLGLEPMYDQEG